MLSWPINVAEGGKILPYISCEPLFIAVTSRCTAFWHLSQNLCSLHLLAFVSRQTFASAPMVMLGEKRSISDQVITQQPQSLIQEEAYKPRSAQTLIPSYLWLLHTKNPSSNPRKIYLLWQHLLSIDGLPGRIACGSVGDYRRGEYRECRTRLTKKIEGNPVTTGRPESWKQKLTPTSRDVHYT